jgi:hypothetical protein
VAVKDLSTCKKHETRTWICIEDRLLPTIASILHSPDKVPVGMPSVGLKYVNSPKSQLDTTSSDKVCQWLAIGLWFSLDTPVSSPQETCLHDIEKCLEQYYQSVDLSTNNIKLIL